MRALLACALLAGCALSAPKPVEPPLGPGEIVSARSAQSGLTVGKSTKHDVLVALGTATVVDFASGYEIWVYRERAGQNVSRTTELVLLFDPSETLRRKRMR